MGASRPFTGAEQSFMSAGQPGTCYNGLDKKDHYRIYGINRLTGFLKYYRFLVGRGGGWREILA